MEHNINENVLVLYELSEKKNESMKYVSLYHFIQNDFTILENSFFIKFESEILLKILDSQRLH